MANISTFTNNATTNLDEEMDKVCALLDFNSSSVEGWAELAEVVGRLQKTPKKVKGSTVLFGGANQAFIVRGTMDAYVFTKHTCATKEVDKALQEVNISIADFKGTLTLRTETCYITISKVKNSMSIMQNIFMTF